MAAAERGQLAEARLGLDAMTRSNSKTLGVLEPLYWWAQGVVARADGRLDRVNRELIYVDVWENIQRRIKIAPLLGKVDCPCCQRRRFEWLEGEQGTHTTSLRKIR